MKNSANKLFLFFVPVLWLFSATAQENPTIKVQGKVYDPEKPNATFSLMVVNKAELRGVFGDPEGNFSISVRKKDTLLINAVGYETLRISFRDSAMQEKYEVKIPLEKIEVEMKTITVFSERDLEEIHEDIQELGYDESDYKISGIDAVQSPITFLYQSFSKRERSRRKVAEMRNEDQKRALLKELFRKYVDAEIIYLSNDEFDEFIDFCNVTQEFMKQTTQYEFVLYIKHRFYLYQQVKGRSNER